MLFTPPKARGLALGLAGLALLIGLDALLLALLRASFPSFAAFLFLCLLLASLPALALIVYRSYGLARARYVLGRNALVVGWGGRREVIPLGVIGEARAGTDVEGPLRPRGLTWPGCVVGRASHPDLGQIEFLAATDKPGMVLVNYPGGWLALSPGDPAAFLQTLAAYQAQGAEERVAPESARPAIERWALWRDRMALALIGLGGLGALLLIGYLTFIFPQLPPEFALHFDAQGQPDRFGPPAGLFILPLIAGLAWTANTLLGLWLYRRESERTGAYLLFGATVFVLALVWVAALGLLTAGQPT